MDFDFDDFITPAPAAPTTTATPMPFAVNDAAAGGSIDDLVRSLSNVPSSSTTFAPPPPPQSMYRPAAPPSYAPPQYAAGRPAAPPPYAAAFPAAVAPPPPSGGWWSSFTSLFGGGGGGGAGVAAAAAGGHYGGFAAASNASARADSAMMVRKRKRKLLREMRRMVEADTVARAKMIALTGGGNNSMGDDDALEVYQVRSTEASPLEEIEDEHDLVKEEHDERVGMDTARTTFVAGVGQIESYNNEWKPFGDGLDLQGFGDAVKTSLGDYEADIQTIRESVAGLGLPSWCFTGVKLGITGALIVATNRNVRGLEESGMLDHSVAYHPKVREAVRDVTAQHFADAARRASGGGGGYPGGNVAPGPQFVNNKPRMPDPDLVPRPGGDSGAAQFVQQQQQQLHHDPFGYTPPSLHPASRPIVSVPSSSSSQQTESTRDPPANRAAYAAQQSAFREAQQQPVRRPDLAPPAFGAPSNFNMQYAAPFAAFQPSPPPPAFEHDGGAAGNKRSFDELEYQQYDPLEQQQQEERVVAFEDVYSDDGNDAPAAASSSSSSSSSAPLSRSNRSSASSATGPKRRRRNNANKNNSGAASSSAFTFDDEDDLLVA